MYLDALLRSVECYSLHCAVLVRKSFQKTAILTAFLDDQDFPPLAPPARSRDVLSTPKSRIDSVHASRDSPARSSTPRIPPGLALPHAHPSPSFTEGFDTKGREAKALASGSSCVTPVLPILPIGHRPTTPKAKVTERPASPKPTEDSKDAFSLESVNSSATTEENVSVALERAAKATAINPGEPQIQPSRANDESEVFPQRAHAYESIATGSVDKQSPSRTAAIPTPERLDISAALSQKTKYGPLPLKTSSQALPQNIVATPTTIESVPSTPIANATKSPEWTSATRPRTLRLTTTTTTPRPEPAPSSALTERSATLSAAVLKQTSRQPSLSSISRSRPSTPTASEHGTSTGISRAGSPPASDIFGSAPERNKTKTQAKKERKAKSKTTDDSRDEESVVSTPTMSEEVGPIISRQKKKKRTQEKSSRAPSEANSMVAPKPEITTTAQTEKAVDVESGKSPKEISSTSSQDHPTLHASRANAKARPGKSKYEKRNTPVASSEKKDQAAPDAAPQRAYTLNDFFNDAAKLPDTENALSELLNVSISATSRLLQELLESNDVDLTSALWNAPPLTSYKLPPQSQKGADYLDANGYTITSPFGEIYLSSYDRKQLLQGRDVRLSDPNKPQNVLKRTMITPSGAIFRHLSAEEEERVIELENRIRENEEQYGVTGKSELKPLDDMDFMNLTGGLQELMAFPPLHRISLLTAEPGTEGTDDDDADLGGNGSDETEDEMAPLASGFGAAPEGPMRKHRTPNTMKKKAEALMAVNLRNLDMDKLQKRIRETQMEIEGARKEMEVLEKKAARKAKDVARWREALLKEVGRGS